MTSLLKKMAWTHCWPGPLVPDPNQMCRRAAEQASARVDANTTTEQRRYISPWSEPAPVPRTFCLSSHFKTQDRAGREDFSSSCWKFRP